MITEISYTHVLEYIKQLCIENKLLEHNEKSNVRFYTDQDAFKGNEMKSPSVIFVSDTGGYTNDADSTLETFTARLLILGNSGPDDSRERSSITTLTKIIADQFAKRIIYDSGFEVADIQFVYAPINRIHKTPIPFDVFAEGWGGYELEFTVGAATNMYVDEDDLNSDWLIKNF